MLFAARRAYAPERCAYGYTGQRVFKRFAVCNFIFGRSRKAGNGGSSPPKRSFERGHLLAVAAKPPLPFEKLNVRGFRSLEGNSLKAFTGVEQPVTSYDRLGCH